MNSIHFDLPVFLNYFIGVNTVNHEVCDKLGHRKLLRMVLRPLILPANEYSITAILVIMYYRDK